MDFDQLALDLEHVVDLKNRRNERHGWVPGQPIDRVHRFLLDLSFQLWEDMHKCCGLEV